ncbi:Crp/Fnr family transcriptional regulator [Nitratireductor sp. GISD-1A_MAKvit]|uniref:Crp/Fnr family transcriptional regulator n=1 Tax=Nitratireductor sp. GISD-1A_MAKvit TaxID=3234198 RepID=UPI003465B05A
MSVPLTENYREILHYLEAETARGLFGHDAGKTNHTGLRKRIYASGDTIADMDGQKRVVMLVVSGWVSNGKELEDGTRTVIDFSLTGDIITVGSTEWAREEVRALSAVTVFELPGAIYENLSTYPRHVREFILKGMARRYARVAEHFVNISRRGAFERVANLLLELSFRVGGHQEDGANSFACPLTQIDLSDALGLSVVHVNRVLRKLREGGYVTFRGGVVAFQNRPGLIEATGFDSSYLALAKPVHT